MTTTPFPREQPREDNIVDESHDRHERARRAQRLAALLSAVRRNPIDRGQGGREREKTSSEHVVDKLKSRELKFAIEKPDAEECWPRVWFIWRGNALMSSAKGHEYFLDHYLGTHTNRISKDLAEDSVKDVEWIPKAPSGKMDLVVDLNFRMDTSALYSDIILPGGDLVREERPQLDRHARVHPPAVAAGAAVLGVEERLGHLQARSRKKFSEMAAKHLPGKTQGRGRRATRPRHAGRDLAARHQGLDRRRGRGDPRQDDAATSRSSSVTTRSCTTSSAPTGAAVRENGLGAHTARTTSRRRL